ncbi:hypothetical protein [Plantibacter sp. YIM 135347]|uniref:hypothetical protein n=1 Tax=Plantibacter sp. YIM 135347 TaxID=3423919 RepID=UPI003D337B99
MPSTTKRHWWLPRWLQRKRPADATAPAVEANPEAVPATATAVEATPPAAPVEPAAPLVAEKSIAATSDVKSVPSDAAEPSTTDRSPTPMPTPDSATAPGPAPTIVVTDFIVADDGIVAAQSTLDDPASAAPLVARIATAVLATEGPIPLLRLVSTIARRLGYSRIGDTRRQDLTALVTAAFPVVDGFVWPSGVTPETWSEVRRTVSREDREVTDISPAEIGNAMRHVLQSGPRDRDALVRETADVLGYGRLGESPRRWLELALTAAVSQGRIIADGDAHRLP